MRNYRVVHDPLAVPRPKKFWTMRGAEKNAQYMNRICKESNYPQGYRAVRVTKDILAIEKIRKG